MSDETPTTEEEGAAPAPVSPPEDPYESLVARLDGLEEDGEWGVVTKAVEAALEGMPRDLTADERAELLFRLGAAREIEGAEDGAREAWEEALSADPGHRRTLLASGNLLFRLGELEAAEKTYRTLLARHRDDLEPGGAAEAYYRLAKIRIEEVGDRDRARAVVEKALNAQPSHLAARRLLIDLHRAADNWEKVIAHERRLLDFEEDDSVRFSALLSLGDTARERLSDMDQAELYYNEAAALRPDDPAPLRRLYDLHNEGGRTQATLRDLARLAGLPGLSGRKRAGWYALMARIYRDELQDGETAIACYNQALDLDSSDLDPFEECNRIHVAHDDWAGAEQHHARMLRRLGRDGSAELRAGLWRNLADIYEQRLGDVDKALTAAEQVVDLRRLDPEAYRVVERLVADRTDLDAGRMRRFHRKFLAIEPRRISSLRALRRVELRDRRPDSAWWLCHRLSVEGDLETDEEAFLENLRRPGLPQAASPLSEELFVRRVRHPDVDPSVERLLALVGPALMAVYSKEPRKVGIRRKSLIAADSSLLFVRALSDLALIMGMPDAPNAHQVKSRKGLTVGSTSPPVLLVGQDMLSGKGHRELGFAIGRSLARFRPAFLAALYVPDESLPWVIRTVIGMADPAAAKPTDSAGVALWRAIDEHVPADDRRDLDQVARQLAQDGGDAGVDAARLGRGIESTCDRVGLLLSEDLQTAVDAIPEERLSDLLTFAISEDHLALREALGIAHTFDDGK